jgi:hydroxyethylthiazole kinase-like uncharacterized protein yjeF
MKILTSVEMAQLDAYTIEHEPVSSTDLMERAATAMTEEILRLGNIKGQYIIFSGPGNNGGDGLCIARILARHGARVKAFLFNIGGHLSADCNINRQRLIEGHPNVDFHEITSQFDLPNLTPDDIVVDALFGTGLNKPVAGGFAALIKFINRSNARVVAVDIPSGLMTEDNTDNYRAHIIKANYTFTLQALKPAMLMADNQTFIGQLKVLNIGLLEDEFTTKPSVFHLDEREEMKSLLRKRDPWGNKGTFGHALLIAGQYGMAGAAILAARACIRSGVGLLTIHTPKVNNAILQVAVPEAVLHHDEDNYRFTTNVKTDPYTAIAIGPGLGDKKDTAVAFIEQISHTMKPVIIDADGLNILAGHKGWIQQIPQNAILTPHPKEFIRMFGESTSAYDMLNQAREQAAHGQYYIVLKGHRTAICTPEGQVYFNSTGCSGMARGGSGDALTGVLLALISQGYAPCDACRLGVYIHGLAGELAARELTEEGMTTGDLINYLPYAFKELKK